MSNDRETTSVLIFWDALKSIAGEKRVHDDVTCCVMSADPSASALRRPLMTSAMGAPSVSSRTSTLRKVATPPLARTSALREQNQIDTNGPATKYCASEHHREFSSLICQGRPQLVFC